MKIFDSKSGKKVVFEPLEKDEVKMYVCGPTVYDSAHLGHGRSAVSFDVIRRYFSYKGFKVTYVSNYTDIDDKMINRAKEKSIEVSELAELVIPEYERDYGALGVMVPDVQPKATEYIAEMIELIEMLDTKGYTYVLDDGVYFDVTKFPDYGKFSGQNLEELQMGARVEVKETKRNPQDFVLWKFKKEGEPSWPSPWGEGRPGWHIECSAMSFKNLGESFDIHGGGLDLKFPHHECEVAQSLACFGDGTFAKYWMHNGFINVDNEKMSKSLGNFFTLKDIFREYDPVIVRFMFLQTHYRNPINFSNVLLDQARAGLERIHNFVRRLEQQYLSSRIVDAKSKKLLSRYEKFVSKFESAMDDDFNTSSALDALFSYIFGLNMYFLTEKYNDDDANFAYDSLMMIDSVFGVIFFKKDVSNVDAEIQLLINERDDARKNKDFATSDKIRDELFSKGIVLDDTPDGTIWKKL